MFRFFCLTGTAGGMLFCEGTSSYAYNPDFVIPAKQYGNNFGIGATTIELWLYAGEPKIPLMSVISIGNTGV